MELQTLDGINFYLDIRGTVCLAPGTPLPNTPEAALQMRGRLVRSKRSIHVDGGDVVELPEYSPHEILGQSFGFVAGAVMPDYAKLPLSTEAQELAGKLFKGISKGVKFLGRGLSWLKGRGAALAAWFAEKLRQWAESRRAKRLAREAEKV